MPYTEVNLGTPLYVSDGTDSFAFSPQDDRRAWADLLSAGILGAGDFEVTFSVGLTLAVAAGIAWIAGGNVADQGLYRIRDGAGQTIAVGAGDGSNPRIDTIALVVDDASHDTSGARKCVLRVVPGTPTAGADLTNLNGKADMAAMTDGSLSYYVLAYILVPTGASSLTSTAVNVSDQRAQATIGSGNAAIGGSIDRGTSLPGSPADGDRYNYIADDVNGIEWALVYDTSQAKWRKIGGHALHAEVATSESTTSATYAALATPGPSVTAPLAGDYRVRHGVYAGSLGSGRDASMSYDIGATGAVAADDVRVYEQAAAIARNSVSRSKDKTLAAGDAVVSKYLCGAGGGSANTFEHRWIEIDPIFVS